MTSDTDASLVARCLRDDSVAMRQLVERYQSDVFSICYRMMRHAHDAEDVTQEVFIRVFRSLARWDSSRHLRPWILGIAINRCRTALSKRSKRPEMVDYLQETVSTKDPDDSQELAAVIQSAVDELRSDYREVFVLFHESGQSYEEISAIVKRPIGTIKTWLHRARTEILSHLTRCGMTSMECDVVAKTD